MVAAAGTGFQVKAESAFQRNMVSGEEPFRWARVKFKTGQKVHDEWDTHPYGDRYFLKNMEKSTGLSINKDWHTVNLESIDEMAQFPFLFMTSEGHFSVSELQQENVREYLRRGGFIYADDCVLDAKADHFFTSYRENVYKLLGVRMVRVENDHKILHSYYDLKETPHCQGKKHGAWALYLDGRMVSLATPGDIHCGWTSAGRRYSGQKSWFKPEVEQNSIKMGINAIVYSMTN